MVSISLISLTISKFISGPFNQVLPPQFKEDTEREPRQPTTQEELRNALSRRALQCLFCRP